MKNALCFVAGAKVITKNGLKNIEDINVGGKEIKLAELVIFMKPSAVIRNHESST